MTHTTAGQVPQAGGVFLAPREQIVSQISQPQWSLGKAGETETQGMSAQEGWEVQDSSTGARSNGVRAAGCS